MNKKFIRDKESSLDLRPKAWNNLLPIVLRFENSPLQSNWYSLNWYCILFSLWSGSYGMAMLQYQQVYLNFSKSFLCRCIHLCRLQLGVRCVNISLLLSIRDRNSHFCSMCIAVNWDILNGCEIFEVEIELLFSERCNFCA